MKRKLLTILCAAACLVLPAALGACSANADLTRFVSEYRSEIYEGTEGEYSIFANYTEREYPYLADGYPADMTKIFEIVLTAPDNTKTYSVSFSYGDISRQAELSFDSVMMVHTWSESLPAPSVSMECSFRTSSSIVTQA